MAILVAGGKGFIGSQVVSKLLARGEGVVCLEPKDTPGRLRGDAGRVAMEVGSVARFEDVLAVFRKHRISRVAALVFFASRGRADSLHAEMSIMVQGTANLFEAARQHGVRRVVFASSIAYYGPQPLHGDGRTPLSEEAPSLARTMYGVGKRLCEVAALEYNRNAGMDIVSMRIPAVYGPRGRVGSNGVNLIATEGATRGRVSLPRPPDDHVLVGHVQDVAEATVALLTRERLAYPVYNVGGHTLSFRELGEIGKRVVPGLRVRYADTAPPMELPYLVDHSRLAAEVGITHRDPETAYRELVDCSRHEAGRSPTTA